MSPPYPSSYGRQQVLQKLAVICLFSLAPISSVFGAMAWWEIPKSWLENRVIPYVFDSGLTDEQIEGAEKNLLDWAEALPFLVFRPRQSNDKGTYLRFVTEWNQACWGHNANRTEPPFICAANVSWADGQHVLGHGLFYLQHEQQRPGRNKYIRVFTDKFSPVDPSATWERMITPYVDVGIYDYQSVMHYSAASHHFRRPGGEFMMETIPPHMSAGETGRISPGDSDSVSRLFGRIPDKWTISTNPLGLTVLVDGEEIETPASFDWQPGSEHTLEVPRVQTVPGSRYTFGRWGDDAENVGYNRRTIVAES